VSTRIEQVSINHQDLDVQNTIEYQLLKQIHDKAKMQNELMQRQFELVARSQKIQLDKKDATELDIQNRIKLAIQEAEICKKRAEILLMENTNQNEPDPNEGDAITPEIRRFIHHQ
jgi:hypothetical protein